MSHFKAPKAPQVFIIDDQANYNSTSLLLTGMAMLVVGASLMSFSTWTVGGIVLFSMAILLVAIGVFIVSATCDTVLRQQYRGWLMRQLSRAMTAALSKREAGTTTVEFFANHSHVVVSVHVFGLRVDYTYPGDLTTTKRLIFNEGRLYDLHRNEPLQDTELNRSYVKSIIEVLEKGATRN